MTTGRETQRPEIKRTIQKKYTISLGGYVCITQAHLALIPRVPGLKWPPKVIKFYFIGMAKREVVKGEASRHLHLSVR